MAFQSSLLVVSRDDVSRESENELDDDLYTVPSSSTGPSLRFGPCIYINPVISRCYEIFCPVVHRCSEIIRFVLNKPSCLHSLQGAQLIRSQCDADPQLLTSWASEMYWISRL